MLSFRFSQPDPTYNQSINFSFFLFHFFLHFRKSNGGVHETQQQKMCSRYKKNIKKISHERLSDFFFLLSQHGKQQQQWKPSRAFAIQLNQHGDFFWVPYLIITSSNKFHLILVMIMYGSQVIFISFSLRWAFAIVGCGWGVMWCIVYQHNTIPSIYLQWNVEINKMEWKWLIHITTESYTKLIATSDDDCEMLTSAWTWTRSFFIQRREKS